ncbi:MAG: glycine zipper 2TM domain-containing protein [Gammaproteobacteria bacterium]|nr:glycine zipper 2TM domain-containing protein [Gammaproteobacteria bacterium]MCP5423853.1 glycine zipper 2TM domain-containing protein [Gammaproteobacteria bacterium]
MSTMLKTLLLGSTLLLGACATTYQPHQYAMGGAVTGAALGAVAGHQINHKNGAYFGAATGALVGGLIGNAYDQNQNSFYQEPPRRLDSGGYSQNPYGGSNSYNGSYNNNYPNYSSDRSAYYK